MTILNLHDRRAIEAIVARMDTEAIGQQLDEGGLSALAHEVIAEELARRVLGGEAHVGGRGFRSAAWFVDRAVAYFPAVWYVVWLVGFLGLLR